MNSSAQQADLKDILQVEQNWTNAFLKSDLKTLELIMDESYKQIQSDGSVLGKTEVLKTFDTGERHWEYAKSDQHQVDIYGETAVLIGRWQAKGRNHGEAFNYQARFVAVYVKRADGWKIVSDQSTDIS